MAEPIIHNATCSSCDIAWLAGLLDGEGYLGIVCQKGRDGKPKWFKAVLRIAMTDEAPCRKALQITGKGTVKAWNRRTVQGKRVWTWQLWCTSAVEVAQLVLPFLTVKSKQAATLIQLGELNGQRKGSNKPLNQVELQERVRLMEAIHTLNV